MTEKSLADSVRKVTVFDVERVIAAADKKLNLEKVRKIDKFAVLFLAKIYADFESFADSCDYIEKNFEEPHQKSWLISRLNSYSKAVEELSRKYKRKELSKALREWRIQKEVPAEVEKIAIELLRIQNGDTVLVINAGDYGFAGNIDNVNVQICGVDETTFRVGEDIEEPELIGKMRASVIDNLQVNRADVLNEDIALQADKVFCGFKGGIVRERNFSNKKLQEFFEGMRCRICKEWLYPIVAIQSQKPGGRTVAIMPGNTLTNEADKEIRKKLVEMGKIEEVINLEKFSMIVFSDSNKYIKMTDADKSADVPIDKIAAKNYNLYPPRYLADMRIAIENARMLADFADITRGAQQIRPSELEEMRSDIPTDYQYITIQDITDSGINENLQYLKPECVKQYERFFADSGDIVISKLPPFRVAVIPDGIDKKLLLSGNLYTMRIDSTKLNPYYLMLFLKSEEGTLQLNAMSSGGNARIITPRNLAEIKIPVPPIEEQNKIAEKYLELISELKEVQQKLSALLENLI